MKICTTCLKQKPLLDFYKDKKSKDGHKWACKECSIDVSRRWHHSNKERAAKTNKAYTTKHRERIKQYRREYEKTRLGTRIVKQREYWQRTKEERYKSKRNRLLNPIFKEAELIRTATRNAYRGVAYGKKTRERLGCGRQEFLNHIETLLKPGMNRDNYGSVWCFDHIVPLVKASSIEELYELSNYKNIQPLFIKENQSKRAKSMEEYIEFKKENNL